MRLEDFADDDHCLWCKGPLPEQRRVTKQYCSKRCYQRHYDEIDRIGRRDARSDRTCKECSQTFDGKRSDQVYCSKACGRIAMRKNTWGIRRCRICEAEFLPNHKEQFMCVQPMRFMECVDRLKERIRCEAAK